MNREQKIQFLAAVREGKLNPKDFNDLPSFIIEASPGANETDVISNGKAYYPVRLYDSYQDKQTGRKYFLNEVQDFLNQYGQHLAGVVEICAKSKDEKQLTGAMYIFRQITKLEQCQIKFTALSE